MVSQRGRLPIKLIFGAVVLTALSAILTNTFTTRKRPQTQEPPPKATSPTQPQKDEPRTATLTTNLEIPWGLAFLSDGSLLITERPGRVRLIDAQGNLLPTPLATLPRVKHSGEGGLLGITLHPNFQNNSYIYLYYTYASTTAGTLNRVVRTKLENGTLADEKVIIDAIPGAFNHNGGRLKFGPDGFLYITTGDAQNPSLAQDKNSLAGKILRVTDEGKPAPDNPFGNLVYSFGHRNPQGLAWDSQGRLWATEHGPQARDELNLIEKGANYGWPEITGDQEKTAMKKPLLHSGSSTWAPAGAAFTENSIFFGGLRGNALFVARLSNGKVQLKEHFKGEFGRIRDVVLGPDGMLYITTSNRDGRGTQKSGDDKIIKLNPTKL